MPKSQFHRICKALRRHGVLVWLGQEADAVCEMQMAEAITFNEKTVVFRRNPSRSVVFEELIHLRQYATHQCDGSKLSRIQCEIEAKEKLLQFAKGFQLTKLDIELTKEALKQDYLDLQYYSKGGE